MRSTAGTSLTPLRYLHSGEQVSLVLEYEAECSQSHEQVSDNDYNDMIVQV